MVKYLTPLGKAPFRPKRKRHLLPADEDAKLLKQVEKIKYFKEISKEAKDYHFRRTPNRSALLAAKSSSIARAKKMKVSLAPVKLPEEI